MKDAFDGVLALNHIGKTFFFFTFKCSQGKQDVNSAFNIIDISKKEAVLKSFFEWGKSFYS